MTNNFRPLSKKQGIVLGLATLLLVVAGLFLWRYFSNPTREDGAAWVDPNATAWDDGIADQGSIQGSISIPGYTDATLTAGSTELALRIGNPSENTCYLQATLSLEDGTTLYQSGLLDPGTGFETIPLDTSLEAGTYNAIVHYQAYTQDDKKTPLNSADSALILNVN